MANQPKTIEHLEARPVVVEPSVPNEFNSANQGSISPVSNIYDKDTASKSSWVNRLRGFFNLYLLIFVIIVAVFELILWLEFVRR